MRIRDDKNDRREGDREVWLEEAENEDGKYVRVLVRDRGSDHRSIIASIQENRAIRLPRWVWEGMSLPLDSDGRVLVHRNPEDGEWGAYEDGEASDDNRTQTQEKTMSTKQIANALAARVAGGAEVKTVRTFGQHGYIEILPLERGDVLVVVGGHDGLGAPLGPGWREDDERDPNIAPRFYVHPVPEKLSEKMQQAHDATDEALGREQRAVQAARSTRVTEKG